jgi:putative cardiolipin synthase
MFSVGPITHNLSAIFDEFWNNKLSIPVEGLQDVGQTGVKLDVQRSHLQQQRQDLQADGVDYVTRVDSGEPFNSIAAGKLPLVWAHVELVADSPDKKKIESGDMVGRLMHREVFNAVNAVQSELLMISPYLIPGKEGMQMFNDLHARHVQLRILTNSMESSTESLAQSGYMHYRKPLLDAGVDLHELRTQLGNIKGSGQTALISSYGTYSLHGKLFVLDRKRLFIGSMNFDQRSLHLNTEIGLIIDSPVLAQQVAARFEAMVKLQNAYLVTLDPADSKGKELIWQTEENGQAVTFHVERARTDWQGFKVRFLTLLPVDDEL